MFQVEINGEQFDAEVTFYTAWLYEAEFKSDMIKDLFGTQELVETVTTDKSGAVARIDFTHTNWDALMRVLWASLKTANPSTKSFKSWVQSTQGVNMWLLSEVISVEVADCFFRAGAAGAEKE